EGLTAESLLAIRDDDRDADEIGDDRAFRDPQVPVRQVLADLLLSLLTGLGIGHRLGPGDRVDPASGDDAALVPSVFNEEPGNERIGLRLFLVVVAAKVVDHDVTFRRASLGRQTRPIATAFTLGEIRVRLQNWKYVRHSAVRRPRLG